MAQVCCHANRPNATTSSVRSKLIDSMAKFVRLALYGQPTASPRLPFAEDSELDDFDTQAVRFKPESLDNLVKLTKFNKRELKLMYRGFKQRKQEITFTDFVIGLSVLTRGTVDEQLRWIFTLYDINGDGVITRDELNKIVGSIYDLLGKFALNSNQIQSPNATANQSSDQTNSRLLMTSSLDDSTSRDKRRQQQAAGQTNPAYSSTTISSTQQQSATLTSEEQAENLFKKFDLNSDGVITIEEFIEACHNDNNIIESISVFNTVL